MIHLRDTIFQIKEDACPSTSHYMRSTTILLKKTIFRCNESFFYLQISKSMTNIIFSSEKNKKYGKKFPLLTKSKNKKCKHYFLITKSSLHRKNLIILWKFFFNNKYSQFSSSKLKVNKKKQKFPEVYFFFIPK